MNEQSAEQSRQGWSLTEDWSAVVVGLGLLLAALVLAWTSRPADVNWSEVESRAIKIRAEALDLTALQESQLSQDERSKLAAERKKATLSKLGIKWDHPFKPWLAKFGSWISSPLEAVSVQSKDGSRQLSLGPLLITGLILSLVGAAAVRLQGQSAVRFLVAFPALFFLAALAYLLAGQQVIKDYNFEYALWALVVGMLICNTVGTPQWLQPAVQGELLIKLGLVLLGGEVLFTRLLALGLPGVCVSWLVTPTVLIGTYIFGQRLLKMESRSLNMVISADMSVCGVSAAIATAAACKAKKEELSLAIGLSLAFTAVMMVIMPVCVQWLQLGPRVGGAWIGGTIDSTGAVVAAGESLGIVGSETAVTVKMIQNILIGVVALGVAIYWTRWVEPSQHGQGIPTTASTDVGISEIWRRFPRFVIGFIAASLLCSLLFSGSFLGECWVQAATDGMTVGLRGWIFCLAFVCIGLTTDFREMAPYLLAGKPMILYLCGQALNLVLTLIMAQIMFGWLFP